MTIACRLRLFGRIICLALLTLSSGMVTASAESRRLVTENSYDGLGRVTETVTKYSDHDAILSLDTYAYDRFSNVISETSQEKARLTGAGDITTVANGEVLRTTRTYDQNCIDKLSTETDARGNVIVSNTYNPLTCLLTESRNALGERETFAYSQFGQLQHHRVYDKAGTLISHKEYAYSARGEVERSITHAIGAGEDIITQYEYDAVGNLTSVTDPYGNETQAAYDDLRRLIEITDPSQAKDVYAYNPRGLLEVIESRPAPQGAGQSYSQVSRISYTPTGRPDIVTDPAGDFINFDYDILGRLEFETDPTGRRTQYHYSPTSDVIASTSGLQNPGAEIQRYQRKFLLPGVEGRLRQAKGIAGNPGVSADNSRYDTLYDYDGFQRLNKITFPDGSFESFEHDENGNITSFRKRSAAIINATYDKLNRLETRITPEFSYTNSYGPLDRLTREAVSDRSADYAFSASHDYAYDYAGRTKQITFNLSYEGKQITKHLHFMYGSDQETTTIGISDSASYASSGLFIHNTMDQMGRLTDIDYFAAGGRLGTRIASYQYDRHGRKHRLAYPGSSISWEYEIDNDLSSETHFFNNDSATPQVRFDHGYDKAGRLASSDVSDPDWLWSPQSDRVTQYDAANELDQITGYTRVGEDQSGRSAETLTVSLGYDDSGNLNSKSNTETGATRTLTYDADNRLIMIEEAPGLKVRYLYDARGRRVVKHILEGAKQGITFYLHYGDQEIAEMDEDGNILTYYIPGAGVDQRTAMIKNTGTCRDNFINNEAECFYYYHANRLGNVIAIAHQGKVEDQYLYSPFGIEEPLTASGNPFRYTGQRYDPESGLYYYKARYYDPVLGRFLQTDPIGYEDQKNLYAYVYNDPLNNTDPTGLCGNLCTGAIGGGIGAIVNTGVYMFTTPKKERTWAGIGANFAEGAAVGFAAGSGAGLLGVAGTGAGSNVVENAITDSASGNLDNYTQGATGVDAARNAAGEVLGDFAAGAGEALVGKGAAKVTEGALIASQAGRRMMQGSAEGLTQGVSRAQGDLAESFAQKVIQPAADNSLGQTVVRTLDCGDDDC